MNIFIIGIVLVTVISAAIIYTLYFLKSKTIGLLSGLILGFIALLIFYNLVHNSSFDINSNMELFDTTKTIFGIPGIIFIKLILFIVPLYLVFVVSSLVFNSNIKDVKARTYGVSFASLLSLSLIGVLVALLLMPLVILIPEELWHDAIHAHHDVELFHGDGEEATFNWVILLIFGIIILSFSISLITRIIVSEQTTYKIGFVIDKILSYITMYFKYLIMLVPFVLFTRLAGMGLAKNISETTARLKIMGIYIGIFMLGAILIFGGLFTSSILLSDNGLTLKEKVSIIMNYALISFANQSAAATLTETQNTSKELGVCDEISKLTPTKGLFMGMVMCNGFTPMLMSIMIFAGAGALTVTNVLLAAIIIISLSISTSGAGSSDYWITATTMTAIFGLGSLSGEIWKELYLEMILVAQEVNEMTVAKPVNGMGHITATLITEKYHRRVSGACECERNDETQEENIEEQSN